MCIRGSEVKYLPANAGDTGSIPGLRRCPGGEVASHSDTVAWEALWTDVAEQATVRGSQGVGQD